MAMPVWFSLFAIRASASACDTEYCQASMLQIHESLEARMRGNSTIDTKLKVDTASDQEMMTAADGVFNTSKALLYAKLAWGAYYPGNKKKDTEKETWWYTKALCYGNTDPEVKGPYSDYKGKNKQHLRANDCEDAPDGLVYQGKIKATTNWLGGKAWADIFFDSANACVVAIAGTDGAGDLLGSDVSVSFKKLINSAGKNTGYKIANGNKNYYEAIQGKIKEACKGKKRIIATGHSLGGATVEVMNGYGDADETWAFAPPNVYKKGYKCEDTKLPNSFAFFATDTTGELLRNQGVLVDGVAAAFSKRATHCSKNWIELKRYKKNGVVKYKASAASHSEPGTDGRFDIIRNGKIHPMYTSYLPYLEKLAR